MPTVKPLPKNFYLKAHLEPRRKQAAHNLASEMLVAGWLRVQGQVAWAIDDGRRAVTISRVALLLNCGLTSETKWPSKPMKHRLSKP